MYTIDRTGERIVVRDQNGRAVYSAPAESFIIHRKGNATIPEASRIRDLTDQQLLLALAAGVEIKDYASRA